MSKWWIIWTTVLILVGIFGLGTVMVERHNEHKLSALSKTLFDDGQNEYLAMYEKWSRLSDEEKAESPWGQDPYGSGEAYEKIKAQQPQRLQADIVELAQRLKEPHVLADLLYGPGWQRKVSEYRKTIEFRDNLAIVSMICITAGMITAIGFSSRLAFRRLADKRHTSPLNTETVQEDPDAHITSDTDEPQFSRHTSPRAERSTAAVPAGNQMGYFEAAALETNKKKGKSNMVSATAAPQETALELEPPSDSGFAQINESFSTVDNSSAVATLMATAPVTTDSLVELTQEMSAIRQFAAQQQDQVKRLQSGYDWNITKRFCLRIIRCIDNLEARIERLADADEDATAMEDVRDELVFALESSGVEQFRPELETSYKGHEKSVEAVKGREKTDKPKLRGKIARIVRPGYQYVVNDNEIKIVRCSQVKLYG